MKPVAIEKRELKQKWVDVIWEIAEGRAGDYETIKSKEVFEFFGILRSYRSRIKKLNGKNSS